MLPVQAACALWLALLFRALGSTAENFFSPILTQMSQEMGLPPRLAGGAPSNPLHDDSPRPRMHLPAEHFGVLCGVVCKASSNLPACAMCPACCAVTFLALGNGAPDISSSIAAITSGNFEMALGALLGAPLQNRPLHVQLDCLPAPTPSSIATAHSSQTSRL